MKETPKRTATPEATPLPDQWVTLARVVRPQGRKGELLAELLTDFPERFRERRRLFLRSSPQAPPREATLERHWLHKGRLVLKFAGIDSIEAVDLLRGHDVVIPRTERAPLEQDAVYIGDLVGCVFYDRATAAAIGEIVDVDRESSNTPLIVVRPAAKGAELLIPFAKAYRPHIDIDGRRMEMTLPEGLLALNEPLTAEEREAARAAAGEGVSEHAPGSESSPVSPPSLGPAAGVAGNVGGKQGSAAASSARVGSARRRRRR